MFKNVSSNVSKWLGVIDNTDEAETLSVDSKGEEHVVEQQVKSSDENQSPESESTVEKENDDLISPETKQTLEDVSAKAISTALEWGSMPIYLWC